MIQYSFGVGGTVTRVLEAGTGDKKLILVHGVGARADRWRRNLDGLAEAGYHTFALDLPGHGLAQKDAKYPHSVPNYAALVREFLDEVSADSETYLIGTSLGGHVCATVACAIPDRIVGLVLVGTLGITPVGAAARERTAGLIREASWETVGRKLRAVLHDNELVTDELHREEFCINNSPGAAEAFERIAAYFADQIDNDVIGESLASLVDEIPMLVVWGREDIGFPLELGEASHAALPGSRFAIMDDAAHAPYYERPETFNTLVTEFFDGQLGDIGHGGVELR